MSLFNRFVFVMLVAELTAYLLTLLPLNFIAVKRRRKVMQTLSALRHNEYIAWSSRLAFMIVLVVFADTLNKLYHNSTNSLPSQAVIAAMNTALNTGDLRQHISEIKSQRNMYLSLFAMFMVLVLYKRLGDMYQLLLLQEEIDDRSKTIKLMKSQMETLSMAAASGDKSEKPIIQSITAVEKISPEATEGKPRKRNSYESTTD